MFADYPRLHPPARLPYLVSMSTHTDWYDDLTNHAPRKAAAERAGLPVSSLNLQYSRGEFRPETVIALARAYRASPVQALAATGLIEEDEAAPIGAAEVLRLATDQQLLEEVMRRIRRAPVAWDFPLGDEPPVDSNGNVTPFRPVVDADLPAVADSSPDNPEEDIEFDD